MKNSIAPAMAFAIILSGATLAQARGTQSAAPGAASSSVPSPSPSSSASSTPAAGSTGLAQGTAPVVNANAINFLHYVNELEIQDANTALSQLTDAQAITLAQKLVSDHTTNDQQVMQLASQKGWTLSGFSESSYDLATDAALGQMSGTGTYDQAFKDTERLNHTNALSQLRLYQSAVTDPSLLSLISQTIPVVQSHIALAGGSLAGSAAAPSGTPSSQPSPAASPSAHASGAPAPGTP